MSCPYELGGQGYVAITAGSWSFRAGWRLNCLLGVQRTQSGGTGLSERKMGKVVVRGSDPFLQPRIHRVPRSSSPPSHALGLQPPTPGMRGSDVHEETLAPGGTGHPVQSVTWALLA